MSHYPKKAGLAMNKPALTDIKAAALGRWPEIHAALGIPERYLKTHQHQPCPYCGGRDRYRYTNHKQGGGFICNQCTPEGGSGFDLLMLVFGYSFAEAVQVVAGALGMNTGAQPEKRPIAVNAPKTPPDCHQDHLATLVALR